MPRRKMHDGAVVTDADLTCQEIMILKVWEENGGPIAEAKLSAADREWLRELLVRFDATSDPERPDATATAKDAQAEATRKETL